MEKNTVGDATGIDGFLFRLIATFEAAAMQQLGKIAHPVTGDVEVDLAGASDSIEMLAAIKRKTEGNLNADEQRLLDHVLYQLRMNYVDVAKEQGETRAEPDADEAPADDADGSDADEAGVVSEGSDAGAAPDEPDAATAPDAGEERTG